MAKVFELRKNLAETFGIKRKILNPKKVETVSLSALFRAWNWVLVEKSDKLEFKVWDCDDPIQYWLHHIPKNLHSFLRLRVVTNDTKVF